MVYKHLEETNSGVLYHSGYKGVSAQQSCFGCRWWMRSYGDAMVFCGDICTRCCAGVTPLRRGCAAMPHSASRTGSAVNATALAMPACDDAPAQRCQPRHHATTPPPPFAGSGPPPYAPMDPGPLPRAQRGLPLARSKLGFGTAMLRCNNLDNISKDWE